jgi:hypothetical protein
MQFAIHLIISQGRLYLNMSYRDQDADDAYSYTMRYAWVHSDRVRNSGTCARAGVKGSDSQTIDAQHPILTGFSFTYEPNNAYRVDQMGVQLDPGMCYVWFNDKDDEAEFFYSATWLDLQ